MQEIKKDLLIDILRLLPKYGLSLERFAYENPYIITGASLRNYITGATRPTDKKYYLISQRLKRDYSIEYNRVIQKILQDHNAENLDSYLESCYRKRFCFS